MSFKPATEGGSVFWRLAWRTASKPASGNGTHGGHQVSSQGTDKGPRAEVLERVHYKPLLGPATLVYVCVIHCLLNSNACSAQFSQTDLQVLVMFASAFGRRVWVCMIYLFPDAV